jgi:phage baseplate assembly protein W
MNEDLVGKGWAFPLRASRTGGIALASGAEELEQSIRLILATAPGERAMRPQFGCGIHEYVFAPADATTAALVATEVRVALARWEPRIDVIDVDVRVDEGSRDALWILITYQPRGHYDPRSLVFPFYVIPEERESVAITGEKAALPAASEER